MKINKIIALIIVYSSFSYSMHNSPLIIQRDNPSPSSSLEIEDEALLNQIKENTKYDLKDNKETSCCSKKKMLISSLALFTFGLSGAAYYIISTNNTDIDKIHPGIQHEPLTSTSPPIKWQTDFPHKNNHHNGENIADKIRTSTLSKIGYPTSEKPIIFTDPEFFFTTVSKQKNWPSEIATSTRVSDNTRKHTLRSYTSSVDKEVLTDKISEQEHTTLNTEFSTIPSTSNVEESSEIITSTKASANTIMHTSPSFSTSIDQENSTDNNNTHEYTTSTIELSTTSSGSSIKSTTIQQSGTNPKDNNKISYDDFCESIFNKKTNDRLKRYAVINAGKYGFDNAKMATLKSSREQTTKTTTTPSSFQPPNRQKKEKKKKSREKYKKQKNNKNNKNNKNKKKEKKENDQCRRKREVFQDPDSSHDIIYFEQMPLNFTLSHIIKGLNIPLGSCTSYDTVRLKKIAVNNYVVEQTNVNDEYALNAWLLGQKPSTPKSPTYVDIPIHARNGSFLFTPEMTNSAIIVTRLLTDKYRVFHDVRGGISPLYQNIECTFDIYDYKSDIKNNDEKASFFMYHNGDEWLFIAQKTNTNKDKKVSLIFQDNKPVIQKTVKKQKDNENINKGNTNEDIKSSFEITNFIQNLPSNADLLLNYYFANNNSLIDNPDFFIKIKKQLINKHNLIDAEQTKNNHVCKIQELQIGEDNGFIKINQDASSFLEEKLLFNCIPSGDLPKQANVEMIPLKDDTYQINLVKTPTQNSKYSYLLGSNLHDLDNPSYVDIPKDALVGTFLFTSSFSYGSLVVMELDDEHYRVFHDIRMGEVMLNYDKDKIVGAMQFFDYKSKM